MFDPLSQQLLPFCPIIRVILAFTTYNKDFLNMDVWVHGTCYESRHLNTETTNIVGQRDLIISFIKLKWDYYRNELP